ncbi:MAG: tryptophan-rich sensory protein [Candidatus Nanoarchaeia archaeon]|nr:tryptophan-rich sensory protein [Candidatus Nanoarchaeia archaeon]
MKSWLKFIISILICQLAGIIGSFFTSSSVNSSYLTLIKPSFNPPSWVFAPVWTILFIMMGVSLFLIWNKSKKIPIIFWIQLSLNILWSVFFFGLESPFLAFICILLLWTAILLTIIRFHKTSRIASYLLIPYLLWVSFAAILNFSIWVLNL